VPYIILGILCFGFGLVILKGNYKNDKKIEKQINISDEKETKVIQESSNTSGLGVSYEVPYEIANKQLNWGAFFLSWLWALGNKLPGDVIFLGLLPLLGNIYLAIRGNKLAWQYKQWRDTSHFHKTQRKWAIAGIVILISFIFLAVSGFLAQKQYRETTSSIKWEFLGNDSKDNVWYFSSKNINWDSDHTVAEIWTKLVYSKKGLESHIEERKKENIPTVENYKNLYESRGLWKINIRTKKVTLIYYIDYTNDGKVIDDSMISINWTNIEDDSIMGKILMEVKK
jgi:hypothetical protein